MNESYLFIYFTFQTHTTKNPHLYILLFSLSSPCSALSEHLTRFKNIGFYYRGLKRHQFKKKSVLNTQLRSCMFISIFNSVYIETKYFYLVYIQTRFNYSIFPPGPIFLWSGCEFKIFKQETLFNYYLFLLLI